MLKVNPKLFDEWDFKKNNKMNLNVYDVTKGSHIIAWWTCLKCSSDFDAKISHRVTGRGCPFCAGKRVNKSNSLSSLRPDIAKEWHPTLNGDLTSHDVTVSRGGKVWWLGEVCGHEWEATTANRAVQGCGCSVCANRTILIGFNDMWTTNPNLAKLLLNPNDGYNNFQRTKKRLDWKCPQCDTKILDRKIDTVHSKGLSCPNCSDGVKYPEKFIYQSLKATGLEFNRQKSFTWSEGKIYDFYIPNLNIIIEAHGDQHYSENGFHKIGSSSLRQEKRNDKIKKNLALCNGINIYATINCKHSDANHIINSIKNSNISNLFENVDFDSVAELSEKSIVAMAWKLWNEGMKSTVEIGKELKMGKNAIRTYLQRGCKIGKCDYTTSLAKIEASKKVKIVQLTLEGELIKKWNSIKEASRDIGKTPSSISECCKGTRLTAYGFKWMYDKDFH